MKLPPYAESLLMLLGAIVVVGFVAVVCWPAAGMLAGVGIFAAGWPKGTT
jgi:hypothetical protein